jgi:hypothetical protein
VTEANTPHLWRIAQARRLFLVALSQNESAVTSSFRSIAVSLENSELSQLTIESSLATIIEKLDAM